MRLKSFETPGIQMSWEASGNKTRHLKSKRQVNYHPNLGRITKGVSGVPLIVLGPGPECQGFKLHPSFGLRPNTCHCRAQQHAQQCYRAQPFAQRLSPSSLCLFALYPGRMQRSSASSLSAFLHRQGRLWKSKHFSATL